MRQPLGFLLSLVLLAPLLTGCLTDDPVEPTVPAATSPSFPACEHPWPCADGSEWPTNLTPPDDGFELATTLDLEVPMSDGVTLDGAVWMPDVPEGTQVPVVLWATPYAGQCRDNPSCDDAPADSEELRDLSAFLWQNGYASAAFNVRGTGLSGGCFTYYGEESQQDMAELVTWLGDQSWSNGRVGMWGVSAMGTTPWMAAIHAPPALKAIAPSGIISDLYLNRFTPQGAPWTLSGAFQVNWGGLNSPAPPGGLFTGQDVDEWPEDVPAVLENHQDRLCPEVAEWGTAALESQYTDDRRPSFWEERRLVNGFSNITTAVLIQQGFQDSGHAFQDDAVWATLDDTPRRMLLGPWGHELFFDEHLESYPGGNATTEVLLTWFDFWLKGQGDPPRLGAVDYKPADHGWEQSAAWPPEEARDEILHLADGHLQPATGEGATFRSVQASSPTSQANTITCGPTAERHEQTGTALVYESEPADDAVLIAGNPMAYLDLASDQPGGLVAVDLYTLDATGSCEPLAAHGAADLRFHQGNSQGEGFPTSQPTWVRVDLWSTAFTLSQGERLVAILSGVGADARMSQPHYAPTLDVSGSSHLVLPVIEGTLGGSDPVLDYPPRPFVPQARTLQN